MIDQTQKVKQGLLQELLTRGIGHTEFKKTEIGEIPVEWNVRYIAECCDICNNFRKPINAETRKKIQGIYPYYDPTKIVDYINEYKLDGEYVLIGEDGDHFLKYNDWSMTQLVNGKFNVNNHTHILRGKNSCSTQWVFHFFKHRNIIPHLTRQGAGRYKLNKAALLEIPLVVPPPLEQKKIVSIISSVDDEIRNEKNKFKQLTITKKGLMQDLLTGKVRVKIINAMSLFHTVTIV